MPPLAAVPQLREALASPASTLTPPAVAKFLGIYSLAVYQGFAMWSPPGRHFSPLTSDILIVPIASQFTVPAGRQVSVESRCKPFTQCQPITVPEGRQETQCQQGGRCHSASR